MYYSFKERPKKLARQTEHDRMRTRSLDEIETSVEFECDALSVDAKWQRSASWTREKQASECTTARSTEY
jgi:hypothetical protein